MSRSVQMTIGPNAAGSSTSNIVRMDDWNRSPVGIQCVVTGTVNYTVQGSMDDPNDPSNPVPLALMTWTSSPDSLAVGATASIMTSWLFVPKFLRILLTSGSGSVVATALQPGTP